MFAGLMLQPGPQRDRFMRVFGPGEMVRAVRAGDAAAVTQMARSGADVDRADSHGWTPLRVAVELGSVPLTRTILRTGADPNIVGKDGLAPLHIAARKNLREITDALVDANARVELKAKNQFGFSPLMEAAHRNYGSIVDALQRNGAALEEKAFEERRSLLREAEAASGREIRDGHRSVARPQEGGVGSSLLAERFGWAPLVPGDHGGAESPRRNSFKEEKGLRFRDPNARRESNDVLVHRRQSKDGGLGFRRPSLGRPDIFGLAAQRPGLDVARPSKSFGIRRFTVE